MLDTEKQTPESGENNRLFVAKNDFFAKRELDEKGKTEENYRLQKSTAGAFAEKISKEGFGDVAEEILEALRTDEEKEINDDQKREQEKKEIVNHLLNDMFLSKVSKLLRGSEYALHGSDDEILIQTWSRDIDFKLMNYGVFYGKDLKGFDAEGAQEAAYSAYKKFKQLLEAEKPVFHGSQGKKEVRIFPTCIKDSYIIETLEDIKGLMRNEQYLHFFILHPENFAISLIKSEDKLNEIKDKYPNNAEPLKEAY